MKDVLEHISVFGVAGSGLAISYTDLDHDLRILIMIGTLIYVWRRALKHKKTKKDEETET